MTSPSTPPLADLVPVGAEPDEVYAAFEGWARDRGTPLYPHQDEALVSLLAGENVVLSTPTGSGKSLVATGAHLAALTSDRVSFYTAPIKALVSEKFFALCELFGPSEVGMLTGDASVNPDAPIICCTAEILANIALREGADADVGLVVMDEFHFYAEPDRGWAWQVPLLELPQAQFVLMSATLGDLSELAADLGRRTGRETTLVTGTERPVPLGFSWALTPLPETIEELLTTHQAPVYVVHFTQAAALEQAQALHAMKGTVKADRDAIAERIGGFRFTAGFGRTLSTLVRSGIGVHHAGMLPRYRRLVEQLAQDGLLKVICGTDTLGVGINVPIRTVLFTGLVKFDGSRQRVLKAREFHQIAGRAGRAGFDSSGSVVVQAPEHVIENARALAKAGDDPKKLKKVQRRKPADGEVSWTEQTYDKLVAAEPEPLVSRMRVDHSMILNVVQRRGDPVRALSQLVRDNHETPRNQARLARRAITLGRSLLETGVLQRISPPDPDGRTIRLSPDVSDDLALNQPLAPLALAAFDVIDLESPTHALDVVSVVEAILDDPRQVLMAQQHKAKGEAVAEMKADGIEYDERMVLLEEVTWPRPLADLLEATFEIFRQSHPWVAESALSPKSVVRDMFERAMTFTEFVSAYQLSRSEGLVLRYLTDAYRTLRQLVPAAHRTEQFTDLLEWLGETVRQTDSSLLDEWEALSDPDAQERLEELEGLAAHGGTRPSRPITANERAFRVMVRNAMFRRVELAARDEFVTLAALDDGELDEVAWDEALGAYYADHDSIGTDADARGPQLLAITVAGRRWEARQTLHDPEGDHDWVIEAVVDLDASDEAGEPVVLTQAMRRL
ncbi:Helicase conserved C-terminal domain-containing protein [Pedococcus dokdonensis]|uniref:Helicase conserved C-terminal domain-containing protein n=1 Tax=Pedococcus dokdonensis TaxID=443156 RepID=A0A1H0Q802_9MICO|nr:DEAD/DEAH box helicase [Pedococcus dokdonensis]SDP12826.1 Helicase conserved C-terminal domain-containing protein [Pedococcus dokdonensis]